MEKQFTAHLKGRTTFKPIDHGWPVVTQEMIRTASEFGAPKAWENPLVKSLVTGYVFTCNVETNLKRAHRIAIDKGDPKLTHRISVQLARLEQIKEEYPLTIV